jgi:Transposase and inactivated derivatives
MDELRKKYSPEFKAKIALEAVSSDMGLTQIAEKYNVHENMIRLWKKRLLDELPSLFSDRRKKFDFNEEKIATELYSQIGRMKVEIDLLKRKRSTIPE